VVALAGRSIPQGLKLRSGKAVVLPGMKSPAYRIIL